MRLARDRADGFRIVAVVLLPPHKGLHILRADYFDLMPKRLELPRPEKRSRAGFQNDRAPIDLSYRQKKSITHHPAPQNDATVAINAMELEHVLGDIRGSPSRFRLAA